MHEGCCEEFVERVELLKRSFVIFTFCDNFLDGHLKSSNGEDSSDVAAATDGTRAPSADSKARPGTYHVPTRIKKFLHFFLGVIQIQNVSESLLNVCTESLLGRLNNSLR